MKSNKGVDHPNKKPGKNQPAKSAHNQETSFFDTNPVQKKEDPFFTNEPSEPFFKPTESDTKVQHTSSENVIQRTIDGYDDAQDVINKLGDAGLDLDYFDLESLEESIQEYLDSMQDYSIGDIMDMANNLQAQMPSEWAQQQQNVNAADVYDPRSEWHPNIPKNANQTKMVGGNNLTLRNDAIGCLDHGENGPPNGFNSAGVRDYGYGTGQIVDIRNAQRYSGVNAHSLEDTRYQHFKAANELTHQPQHGGNSPPNQTWHHRKQVGEMQLLDRTLHAAFLHRGGYAEWGS